jgi:hypothetical protein
VIFLSLSTESSESTLKYFTTDPSKPLPMIIFSCYPVLYNL